MCSSATRTAHFCLLSKNVQPSPSWQSRQTKAKISDRVSIQVSISFLQTLQTTKFPKEDIFFGASQALATTKKTGPFVSSVSDVTLKKWVTPSLTFLNSGYCASDVIIAQALECGSIQCFPRNNAIITHSYHICTVNFPRIPVSRAPSFSGSSGQELTTSEPLVS